MNTFGAYMEQQPEEIDCVAHVTPQDVAAASGFWRCWGTPLLNRLLDAKPQRERIGVESLQGGPDRPDEGAGQVCQFGLEGEHLKPVRE